MLEPEVVPLTPEQLQELQVKAYERHLRHLEYKRKWRAKNKEYYNTSARLKMYALYHDDAAHKEKQQIAYYKRRYGVSTVEEVQTIKAKKTKERLDELISKLDNNVRKKGRPVKSFEEYTKNI